MKIILTNKGFKEKKGIYIGRPSPFGNPYPIKKSKFFSQIYSLQTSLLLYNNLILTSKIEISSLIMTLKNKGLIQLNCFCVNKIFSEKSLYYLEKEIFENKCRNLKCHGEILAYHLLKNAESE